MAKKKYDFRKIAIIFVIIAAVVAVIAFALSREREDFKSTSYDDLPSILYFTADWCFPCKEFRPIITEIRDKYDGRINVIFYDIDTDVGGSMSASHNVTVVPTLVFANKTGAAVGRTEGLKSRIQLEQKFKELGWIE